MQVQMLQNFNELGLSEEYVQILEQQQITQPTPIQSQAIPALLQGNNILGLAATGSGKTLAYGLPMLENVDSGSLETQALVLCPTRELANQVATEIKKFTRNVHGFYTTAVYGGESMERQIKQLKAGSQIVIGTPGRIIDHLKRQTLKVENLKYVVLDEADEMLSMGFEEDIRLILDYVNTSPQIALFSATMSKQIRQIASQYLGKYLPIEIAKSEANKPDISQHYLDVHPEDKAEVLLRLINFYGFERCMAFCNTKLGTDKLVQQLAEKGYMAEAIHGDMAQLQRTSVMRKFKNGQVPLLVATDVAARGIDVSDVEAVFNVDLPRDTEYYVHRIGRTGRAGKSGYSFALVMKSDFRQLKIIERFTNQAMTREKVPSLQAIAYKHQSDFLQTLRLHSVDEDNLQWTSVVDQLETEGFDPKKILAYLIGKHMGPIPSAEDPLLDKLSRERERPSFERSDRRESSSRYESSNDGGERRPGRGRPPGSGHGLTRKDTEKMVKIRFNVGRNAKIRPSDLVGAIASEANVSGKRLGYIGIEEKFSFVDVPAELASQIVKAMAGNVVRGKKVRVEVA
jgi:ATP-dependent RNA helicase DeaD